MIVSDNYIGDRINRALPIIGAYYFWQQAKLNLQLALEEDQCYETLCYDLGKEPSEKSKHVSVKQEWFFIKVLALVIILSWLFSAVLLYPYMRWYNLIPSVVVITVILDFIVSRILIKIVN